MDQQTDRVTYERKEGCWKDRWADRQTEQEVDRQMDKGTDGWIDWPTDRWTDKCKYGQMGIERDRQPGKAYIMTHTQRGK